MPLTNETIRAELRFRAAMSGKPEHRTLYNRYMAALDAGDTVLSLGERVQIWARSERLWQPSSAPTPDGSDPTGGSSGSGVIRVPEYKELKSA